MPAYLGGGLPADCEPCFRLAGWPIAARQGRRCLCKKAWIRPRKLLRVEVLAGHLRHAPDRRLHPAKGSPQHTGRGRPTGAGMRRQAMSFADRLACLKKIIKT